MPKLCSVSTRSRVLIQYGRPVRVQASHAASVYNISLYALQLLQCIKSAFSTPTLHCISKYTLPHHLQTSRHPIVVVVVTFAAQPYFSISGCRCCNRSFTIAAAALVIQFKGYRKNNWARAASNPTLEE